MSVVVHESKLCETFFASPLTPLLRNDYQGGFEVNMVVN